MQHYRVKNWKKFQHFKDRRPPWIKLYRDILDDVEWHELEPKAAKVLIMLWLIASESDGELPGIKTLCFRLRLPERELSEAISRLGHWLEPSDIKPISPAISQAISPQYQSDAPETETEREVEGEKERKNPSNIVAQPPREQPKPEPVNNLPLKSVVEKASYNPTYQAVTPHPRFNEVREYITHRLPHLNRVNATEVNRWLLDGADPEKDIFPTVDNAIELKRGDIGSFKYFTRGVESSMRVRKEAAEQHERLMQKYAEEDQRAKERAEHGEAE